MEIFNWVFNHPDFLRFIPLAVIAVAALTLLMSWVGRKMVTRFGKRRTLLRFSSLRIARWRNAFYLALAISLLLVALADPVILYHRQVEGETLNYVAVIDVSRSMGAEDYPAMVARIEMARRSLLALYDAYPNGAVGVVAFTDDAVPYQATTDRQVVRYITLYGTDLDSVKGSGSDIPMALGVALDLVEDSPQEIRTIILLTDGGSETMAGIQGITKRLMKLDVSVIAGGLGSYDAVKIPVRDEETGEIVGWHRFQGKLAVTALNEEPLIALTEATDGQYVRIIRGDELVQIVRRGGYADDVVLEELEEQENVTSKVLGVLMAVIFVWLLDKRFIQGWIW